MLILIVLAINCFSVIIAGQMGLGLPEIKVIKEVIQSFDDSNCKLDLLAYIENIRRNEKNALTMFDSMVKYPFGLIHGNMYQLGNFDECISVVLNITNDSNRIEVGQYCLIDIQINITLPEHMRKGKLPINKLKLEPNEVQWAVCVPSSCAANQTDKLAKKIIDKLMPGKPLIITVTDKDCYHPETYTFAKLSKLQLCFSIVLIAYLLLICYATLYHNLIKITRVVNYTINEPVMTTGNISCSDILDAFALFKNMKIAFDVRAEIESKQNNLCGLRVMSMLLLFIGNALVFLFCAPQLSRKFMKTSLAEWQNALLLNNPLMLDTLLMTSGFKAYWIIVNELSKSTQWNRNILRLTLFRLCTFIPAYIVMILFYATFIEDIGSGPLWKRKMQLERERCLSSWWANLMFINNYLNTDKLCITPSWYLSVVTQLFLTAPLLCYPLIYNRKLGNCLLIIVCLVTTAIPFIISNYNNLDPALMLYPKDVTDLSNNYYFTNYFIKTHTKANAYYYGITMAYIIQRLSTKSYRLPKILQVVISLMAIISAFASIYTVIIFYKSDYVYSSTVTNYAPLNQIGWCLTVGWIFIISMNDNSIVNNFLSHKIWIRLNRLLYCSYLVNGVIELYCYGQTRSPRHLNTFNLTCEVLSHIVLTLFGGFLLHVLFECPMQNLEKAFRNDKNTRTAAPVSNVVEIESLPPPPPPIDSDEFSSENFPPMVIL